MTLRLLDRAYHALKRYARLDKVPIDSTIEGVVEIAGVRRRCAAHDQWMRAHPEAAAFSQAWADRNLGELAEH
jgi:hypothetical protein